MFALSAERSEAMVKLKCTPHPWSVIDNNFRTQVQSALIKGAFNEIPLKLGVCNTGKGSQGVYISMTLNERRANAAVIAVAPEAVELLGKIKQTVFDRGHDWEFSLLVLLDEAEALIKRATDI